MTNRHLNPLSPINELDESSEDDTSLTSGSASPGSYSHEGLTQKDQLTNLKNKIDALMQKYQKLKQTNSDLVGTNRNQEVKIQALIDENKQQAIRIQELELEGSAIDKLYVPPQSTDTPYQPIGYLLGWKSIWSVRPEDASQMLYTKRGISKTE